jgi:sugar phosphate isomerase/epimerase
MIDRLAWVAASGYEGVETPMFLVDDLARFRDALADHELDYIAMAMTFGCSVDDHLAMWRDQMDQAASVPHRFVVAHAGSDAWDPADVDRFYTDALAIAADRGLTVAFETHRSRPLFNPWATARVLDRFPELEINCDYSHWVVVTERLLGEEEDLSACAPIAPVTSTPGSATKAAPRSPTLVPPSGPATSRPTRPGGTGCGRARSAGASA